MGCCSSDKDVSFQRVMCSIVMAFATGRSRGCRGELQDLPVAVEGMILCLPPQR